MCQKNRAKMQTTSAEGGNDPLLSPETQAAAIVWRLRNAPGQMHSFFQDGKLAKIAQSDILDCSRSVGHAIGEESLGF